MASGTSAHKFRGPKSDDLSVAANRRRIFGARLAELDKNAGLAASDEGALNDEERSILSAMRDDLVAWRILMRYDMHYAPDDRNAPLSTEVATNLSDLIGGASSGIKTAFANCPVVPASERRAFEYGVS